MDGLTNRWDAGCKVSLTVGTQYLGLTDRWDAAGWDIAGGRWRPHHQFPETGLPEQRGFQAEQQAHTTCLVTPPVLGIVSGPLLKRFAQSAGPGHESGGTFEVTFCIFGSLWGHFLSNLQLLGALWGHFGFIFNVTKRI